MLGVGLHSYGLRDKAFGVLIAFIISQLAIMCMGMVPQKYWPGIQAGEQSMVAEQPKAVLAQSAVAKQ